MPYAEWLARVGFYPTLVYTYFLSRVTSRTWYTRVDPWVLVGALPLTSYAEELVVKEKVRGVVSLTHEFEEVDFTPSPEDWRRMGVEVLHVSTLDFTGSPSQKNIRTAVHFIMRHRRLNHSVYVHCKAGRTRSVTVVVCYLIKAYAWTPDQAISHVTKVRPHIWLREKQLRSIYKFCGLPYSSSDSSSSSSDSSINSHQSDSVDGPGFRAGSSADTRHAGGQPSAGAHPTTGQHPGGGKR